MTALLILILKIIELFKILNFSKVDDINNNKLIIKSIKSKV